MIQPAINTISTLSSQAEEAIQTAERGGFLKSGVNCDPLLLQGCYYMDKLFTQTHGIIINNRTNSKRNWTQLINQKQFTHYRYIILIQQFTNQHYPCLQFLNMLNNDISN